MHFPIPVIHNTMTPDIFLREGCTLKPVRVFGYIHLQETYRLSRIYLLTRLVCNNSHTKVILLGGARWRG